MSASIDLDPATHLVSSDWLERPSATFDAFLGLAHGDGRAIRASSARIYRGMFERLRVWLDGQGKALFDLDESLLEDFLTSRDLHARTRHRYLLVFRSLCAHLRGLQALDDNPARKLLLAQRAPDNDSPESLTPEEVQALWSVAPTIGVKGWKNDRLQAMLATLLATGLHSQELLSLKVDEVRLQPVALVELRARAPRRARRIPWAGQDGLAVMEHWMMVRSNGLFQGDRVFPARLSGEALSAATLFRQVQACLEAAGVHRRYEGPALLRNTCIARWLASHPVLDVQAWAGHQHLNNTVLFSEGAQAWREP